MSIPSDFIYNRVENHAVNALQGQGLELHCVTYGNDVAKCVEDAYSGISIHLPNSTKYDELNEEFNTYVVAWDAGGTGRDVWMFETARACAMFVRSAPHPDTHTAAFIAQWETEMNRHRVSIA